MPPANINSRFGQLIVKMAGSKTFRVIGPKIVPHADRILHKLTGGRIILSRGLLPSLMLTTIGAKTGQKRTTPLATLPQDDAWYIVGSNFGRDNHPAWTANLAANPDTEISFNAKDIPVRAHQLTADEKQAFWPTLVQFWPNFDVYTEASGRDLRVFRLDPRT